MTGKNLPVINKAGLRVVPSGCYTPPKQFHTGKETTMPKTAAPKTATLRPSTKAKKAIEQFKQDIIVLSDLDLQMSILKEKYEAQRELVKSGLKERGMDELTVSLDNGEFYKVSIVIQNRSTLDRKALENEYGKAAISRFLKPNTVEVFRGQVVKDK